VRWWRWETKAERFVTLLVFTGVPVFVLRCAWYWKEVQTNPGAAILAFALRDLLDTVVLWAVSVVADRKRHPPH